MAQVLASGTLTGSTTLNSPNIHLICILSGQYAGFTILGNSDQETLSGSLTGSTALNSPNLHFIRDFYDSHFFGRTTLTDSAPQPLRGVTTLTGRFEVIQSSSFIIGACSCDNEKEFRYGHTFTRFDLPIYVKDPSCRLKISPFEVTYSMFRKLPNGALELTGTPCRAPVTQNTGEFYATGTAGEFGQPGEWEIHWYLRRSFNDYAVVKAYSFRVVDTVSSPIPGQTAVRKNKYGWM